MDVPILSGLVLLPTLGALFMGLVPKGQDIAHKAISTSIALLTFIVSLSLLGAFDDLEAGFQLREHIEWIPSIGAAIRLGVDGISLWIVMLTTFLTPLILIGSYSSIDKRWREFGVSMLVLESAMLGTLFATDLLLFYLFWELMLVPMYLLIGIWGGKRRLYATVKFFLYTMVGSLLMLVGIIYLYLEAGSFDYEALLALRLEPTEQLWLFGAFALAFLIKVPVFPFHTWLPDAHTEAPTAGSVILAGVLLKMGTYGFLRFALPLFPHAMAEASPLVLILSTIGIVYGAMVAWAQLDVKKLVAYSSVSHLGFVMLGIVALNTQAVEGAILQMINHGISTGALFLLVGVVYERRHTRAIEDYGGLAASMPRYTLVFIIVTMSSIGLPGTNGFVGEFLILSGTMMEGLPADPAQGWPALVVACVVIATSGVILGAIYMLSMVRRVFFGPIVHEVNRSLEDLNLRETLVLAPLVIAIFVIGLFPGTLLGSMHASVDQLVTETRPHVDPVRDPRRPDVAASQGIRPDVATSHGAHLEVVRTADAGTSAPTEEVPR